MAIFQITGLDDLVARVSQRAGGSSDPNFTTAIEEAVAICEAEMNTRLRVPEMMVRSLEVVDERWESMPSDFIQIRQVYWVNGSGKDIPLKRVSPELAGHYAQFRPVDGPTVYTVVGGQYRIEPRTDGEEYNVRLIYYAKVPTLFVADSELPDTTILNRYPQLYLWGTLAGLADYLVGDERVPIWRMSFEREMLSANIAAGSREASAAVSAQ